MAGADRLISALLILNTLISAHGLVPSKFVLRPTTACPEAGYFLGGVEGGTVKAGGEVGAGGCYLCLCRGREQAACWLRDAARCDLRTYPHTIKESDIKHRSKRNLGLGDLLKDTTFDFFSKNSGEKCEPHKGSYSEGCPPADWCQGCTVCDCTDEGRWSCHRLSFCNDDDKKNKNLHSNANKPKTKKASGRKSMSNKKKPKHTTRKPRTTTKRMKKIFKKSTKKSKQNSKNQEQNNKPKLPPRKKIIKRIIYKVNNKKKRNVGNMSKEKILLMNVTHKAIQKNIQQKLKNIMQKDGLDETELGQMFVKQVMTTVNKMISKELQKYNMSKVLRNADCKQAAALAEKQNSKRFMQVMRQMQRGRDKREALDFSSVVRSNNTAHQQRDILNQVVLLDKYENKTQNTTANPLYLTYNIHNANQSTSDMTYTKDYIVKIGYDEDVTNVTESEQDKVENNTASNVPDVIENNSDNATETTKNNLTETNTNPNIPEHPVTNSVTQIQNPLANEEKDKEYIMNRTLHEPKVHQYNIHKILSTKKHNMRTIFMNIFKRTTPSYYRTTEKEKVNNLTNLLNNLSKNINKQKVRTKSRYNFFRKLRMFFNQMFEHKQKKRYKKWNEDYQTLKILCRNVKSCHFDKNSRRIIKTKLKQLKNHSETIFKILKILKGLLRLIDSPHSSNVTNKTECWKADIQKLNAILKDTYKNSDNTPLTETQLVQIQLIKQNTQVFIETAAKFTRTLHDIINGLSSNHKVVFKDKVMFKPKDDSRNVTDSMDNVKNLIVKHNLTRNKRMNKIYKEINEMGREKLPKVSSRRNKRQIQQPMDYMFALMEYLLKTQNPSTMTTGQADDIDLLIEAIRNSPDISTVKNIAVASTQSYTYHNSSESKTDSESDSFSEENKTINNNKGYTRNPYKIDDEVSQIIVFNEVPDEPITSTAKDENNNNETETQSNNMATLDKLLNDTSESLRDMSDSSYNVDSQAIRKKNEYNKTNTEKKSKVLKFKSIPDTSYNYAPFFISAQNDLDVDAVTVKKELDDKAKLEWIIENFGNGVLSDKHTKESKANVTDEAVSNSKDSEEKLNTTVTEIMYNEELFNQTEDTKPEAAKKEISVNEAVTDIESVENSVSNNNKSEPVDSIMQRKQLSLLNSLDYETEKPDYDEAEMRDEDKFSDPYTIS